MTTPKSINGVPISDLLTYLPDDEPTLQRISFRTIKPSLEIVPYSPTWPSTYLTFASRITTALDSSVPLGHPKPYISISHVGSTSVPHLPAKAIIDIDLIVPSITNEAAYVPALEKAGFQFMLREPKWYEHRFFTAAEPMFANLHVWGPNCAASERHRIFREWLCGNEEDREAYARIKREASEASRKGGETVMEYNRRKEKVLQEIMGRAFKALGIVEGQNL